MLLRWMCVAALLIGSPTILLAQAETNRDTNENSRVKNSGDWSTLKDDLQKQLDSIVEGDEFPGATLAVVMPNGESISLASGFADKSSKTPMPVAAKMMIGSTGKTFVSAVAFQLIAEGKFALDDKAGKFFDGDDDAWFQRLPNFDKLTIRSLMNHTSGIPRYIFQREFMESIHENPQREWTPKECIELVLDQPATHKVGEGWGYSDTNYLLLGLVIEKVTGESYYDLVQTRILDPLNLHDTIATTQAELKGLCQGHVGSQNPFRLPANTVENGKYCLNPKFEWCGGGFMSSVDNMAKWIHQLHTGNVLEEKQYALLTEAVDFRTGKPTVGNGYGLGSFVWKTDSDTFFGHAGMMPGYLTQLEHSKKHGFTIAFQTNSDETMGQKHHSLVQEFANTIANRLDK